LASAARLGYRGIEALPALLEQAGQPVGLLGRQRILVPRPGDARGTEIGVQDDPA